MWERRKARPRGDGLAPSATSSKWIPAQPKATSAPSRRTSRRCRPCKESRSVPPGASFHRVRLGAPFANVSGPERNPLCESRASRSRTGKSMHARRSTAHAGASEGATAGSGSRAVSHGFEVDFAATQSIIASVRQTPQRCRPCEEARLLLSAVSRIELARLLSRHVALRSAHPFAYSLEPQCGAAEHASPDERHVNSVQGCGAAPCIDPWTARSGRQTNPRSSPAALRSDVCLF